MSDLKKGRDIWNQFTTKVIEPLTTQSETETVTNPEARPGTEPETQIWTRTGTKSETILSDRGSKEGKAILGIAEESEDWALKVIDFGTKPARPATRTKAVTGNHDTKMGMDFRKSSGARYSNVWFRATYIGNTEAASARSAHGLGHAFL